MEYIKNPMMIEEKSFIMIQEIIDEIRPGYKFKNEIEEKIIKRSIHTTADFEYLDILKISDTAVENIVDALKNNATIYTDTNMALSGINKRKLDALGCKYRCLVAEEETANLAKEKGNQYVHNMLYDIDIESFNSIHFNNLKRVIRALEVYKITNKPFSSFKEDQNNIYESPYNIYYYVLNMDRKKLYCRINKRVDMMLEKGLLEEVKSLKNMGLIADMQSMKGIGYKELLYYLDNKISFEEAVEMIKQGSRNYAKRQLTWFRKDPRAIFINKDDFMNDKEIITKIIGDIKKS